MGRETLLYDKDHFKCFNAHNLDQILSSALQDFNYHCLINSCA